MQISLFLLFLILFLLIEIYKFLCDIESWLLVIYLKKKIRYLGNTFSNIIQSPHKLEAKEFFLNRRNSKCFHFLYYLRSFKNYIS